MAMTVVCDICGDGQTPAMKTCLRCEMSYCFSHFKPHLDNSRLKDHAVVDPTGSLDERLCPEHSEELKFYCTVDSSLVCSSCNIAGEHKGHDVTTLKDEHETRKMYVGEETRAVEEKINEAEKYLKRMYTAHRKAQKSVAGIRGCITSKFARLRKALDEDEREALRRVGVKERDLLSRIEENIACHKGEIAELQAAATRLGTLQLEKDSLTFLQTSNGTTTLKKHTCGSETSSSAVGQAGSLRPFLHKTHTRLGDKDKFKRSLAFFCAKDTQPFSVVEDAGFRELVAYLIDIGVSLMRPPDLDDLLPVPNTVKNHVEQGAERVRAAIRQIVQTHVDDGLHVAAMTNL
ncbi:unnamed protein product [Lampetra fluviatilis]